MACCYVSLQAAECFSDPKTAAAMTDMLREAERHSLSMESSSPWALTGGQQDQHGMAGNMAHYGQHQVRAEHFIRWSNTGG